jgi:hypothetical protein
MHLALAARLMEAVRNSGIETHVVNAAFPDMTNASLARVGLAPTVGVGNMDLIVPYIRKAAAEMLGVPMSNIGVEMVAHHYHGYNWCRSGGGYDAPHYLRVYVGRQDVTGQLGDLRQFVAELPRHGRRPAGRHGQFVVAASSVKNISHSKQHRRPWLPAGGGGGPCSSIGEARSGIAAEMTLARQRPDVDATVRRHRRIRDNGDVVLTDGPDNFCGTLTWTAL